MEPEKERKVPMLKTAGSLIEQEFDSIKEKFELEMRKMEDEMSRFRSELMASESRHSMSHRRQIKSQQTASQRISSTCSRSSKVESSSTNFPDCASLERPAANLVAADKETHSSWLDELDSPLIKVNEDGDKLLKLRFDLSDYEPEQIVVKTLNGRLQVQAKRENKTHNSSSYSEYNREFLLPRGLNVELIRSSLSADGVLTVEAPL